MAYARRLHREQPQLSVEQLAQLSGALPRNLRQDPTFQRLPEQLQSIQAQWPREPREPNVVYARRLHREQPRLSIEQLAQLSGAVKHDLRRDPAFKTLPAALQAIQAKWRRADGEPNAVYARRLHRMQPELSIEELAQLSGATVLNLRSDPTFWQLPEQLEPIRAQWPRGPREPKVVYARRLHREQPQLSIEQLAQLSGTPVGNLRQYPTLRTPSEELQAIRAKWPQDRGEPYAAYARRLHGMHPELSIEQLAEVSGTLVKNLRADPTIHPLPDYLEPIRLQSPRNEGESRPKYARRLHRERPDLSIEQLAQLSGTPASQLRRWGTAFRRPDAVLDAIRARLPRQPAEPSRSYAQRLRAGHPELSIEQLAQVAGTTATYLRSDPTIHPLPEHLESIRLQSPRNEGESGRQYARRLHLERPDLSIEQLAQLSGIAASQLRLDTAFRQLDAVLDAIRARLPRQPAEPSQRYAQRLHEGHPELSREAVSMISGVPKDRLPPAPRPVQRARRAETPEPTPFEQLLNVRPWVLAGAMALMRRDGLPFASAAALAGVTPEALGFVSDEHGHMHPARVQAAFIEAAGDDPRGQALLDSLRQQQQAHAEPSSPPAPPAPPAPPSSAPRPGEALTWGSRQPRTPRLRQLDRFAAELEQALQTPPAAPPQAGEPAEPLAWGARRARSARAERGLADPGPPLAGDLEDDFWQLEQILAHTFDWLGR